MASAHRFGGEAGREDFVPIRGWHRGETKPLLEALAPFRDSIEDVLEYAQDALDSAERYLRRHGGRDPHGLNLEQIAAIRLYTKENIANPDQSFFRVLNRTLNSEYAPTARRPQSSHNSQRADAGTGGSCYPSLTT